jgi:cephalosporin hydroxylase
MKLIIDTKARLLYQQINGKRRKLSLYSKEAFELISFQWLKIGWDQKYPYTFSWLGRPIIQIPEDLLRVQEVIYSIKPDIIIETGVAHGGSLIYYASLCKLIGKGRVVGIDIEIRPHNRKAIESHELHPLIYLIEGNSTDARIIKQVKALIQPEEKVLIILDSCHSKQHVISELNAYHGLVTVGSYLIATDGVTKYLCDVPRGKTEWERDNPQEAVKEFLKGHPEFKMEQPEWIFNESKLAKNITHWPKAWLKRKY